MQPEPTNIDIPGGKDGKGISIGTWDLLILALFVLVAAVLALYVIGHADSQTWKRLIAVFSALASFLAGWFGKKVHAARA